MSLGKRIKAARTRLKPKMGQQKIADELGVTVQAVSGWERDCDAPSFEKIAKLRKILRVTYVWLMEGDGPPPDADSPEVRAEDLAPELQKSRHRAA